MPVGLTLYDVLGIPTDATTDDGSLTCSSHASFLTHPFCSEEGIQDKGARNTPRQARTNSERPREESCRGQVQKRMTSFSYALTLCALVLMLNVRRCVKLSKFSVIRQSERSA